MLGGGGWAFNRSYPTVLPHLLGECGDARAPDGHALITRGQFASRAMGASTAYVIARPPLAATGPLTVVVALHGRGTNAVGALHLGWYGFALDAMARGAVRPFALAAADGGDATYWHRRVSGIDPMSMLLDEFLPLLAKRGLGGTKSTTGLYGWSMGGYGALLAAETAPELFGAVAAASPAFWWTYADAASGPDGTFDGPADWADHDIGGHLQLLANTPVRVDCGSHDPFAPAVQRLLAALPSAQGGISAGCHTDGFWRSVAADQIAFLDAHLPGV